MSDYDVTKYFQDRQQRFEAALKFATTKCEYPSSSYGSISFPSMDTAIQKADELLTKLDETEK